MELSPDDRQRIYEEEKARHDAQQNLRAKDKSKNAKYGCNGCLGLIVLFAIIDSLVPKSNKTGGNADATMAYIMAKQFIQRQLKAPGTAEFPSEVWNEGEVRIVKLSSGSYRVSAG